MFMAFIKLRSGSLLSALGAVLPGMRMMYDRSNGSVLSVSLLPTATLGSTRIASSPCFRTCIRSSRSCRARATCRSYADGSPLNGASPSSMGSKMLIALS